MIVTHCHIHRHLFCAVQGYTYVVLDLFEAWDSCTDVEIHADVQSYLNAVRLCTMWCVNGAHVEQWRVTWGSEHVLKRHHLVVLLVYACGYVG